jgi:hypothetical protein
LTEIKARIDVVHERVLHALRAHDEEEMDRAMEEQHRLLQEYSAILREPGEPT